MAVAAGRGQITATVERLGWGRIVVNRVFAVSYLLTLLALIAVFAYTRFVSQWAFWVLVSCLRAIDST